VSSTFERSFLSVTSTAKVVTLKNYGATRPFFAETRVSEYNRDVTTIVHRVIRDHGQLTTFAHNPTHLEDGHSVKYTRIIVTHYGKPDALQVIEKECPEPKAGEVRVKVLAAGVSLPDVLAREGVHPETPHVPYTPGWDLVGIVDQIGAGASGFERGQTVKEVTL
jgi:hypothetical protein